MLDQEKIDLVMKHPMFYPGLAAAGLVLLFLVLLKFLAGPRVQKSERSQEEGTKASISSKRKKVKKQKGAQEKKASDSPKPKKEPGKSGVDSLVETNARTVEESKHEKKRDGKSKTKSKKKKNVAKVETAPEVEKYDESLEGEWQTVSTKEQREQMKREKKKQEEENVAVAMETAEKSDPVPLVQPALKQPPSNITAIAKGIAPRFAKAAGEPWQEKGSTTTGGSTLQSKRPMPPATIPGVPKQPTKTNTVKSWMPEGQAKPLWSSDLSSWPETTNNSAISSDLIGMTWPHSMATSNDKGAISGWPQGGATWQSQGNERLAAEEWVDVSSHDGQNGRAMNTESWAGGNSPARNQTLSSGAKKGEPWTMEPEGFPVEPPALDPSDPWNFEVVELAEGGDWSAPASTWDNTTEEWKAPAPVVHEPTYIDESSEDEKSSGKATSRSLSNQQNSTSLTSTTTTQSVVGAGPDFMSQGQNKKSRRRRKKKQGVTSDPEQVTSPSPTVPATNEPEASPEKITTDISPKKKSVTKEETMVKETKPIESSDSVPEQTSDKAKDDWATQKIAKKRKPKARKAD